MMRLAFFISKNMDNLEPLGEAWNYDRAYHRAADLLGVNPVQRQNYRLAEKIYYILEQLHGASPTDVLVKLEEARKGLGTSQTGELLVNQLYSSMRLRHDVGFEKEQQRVMGQQQEAEKQQKQQEQIEMKAQKELKELEAQLAAEQSRIKELTELQARVSQVQGGTYA